MTAGDILHYKITKAQANIAIGLNKTSVKGFNFNGINFPINTKCQFKINYIDTGLNGEIAVGSESSSFGFLEDWYVNLLPFYHKYVSAITNELVFNWFYYNFTNGLLFKIYPYFHPTTSNLAFFSELDDSLNSFYSGINNQFPYISFNSLLDESPTSLYFETYVGGELDGIFGDALGLSKEIISNVTFGNHFHIKLNPSSGIVEGFGFKGWVDGIMSDQLVSVFMDYAYKLVCSWIPNYQLGPKSYLGLIICIPVVFVISGIAASLIVVKKKKKHLKAIAENLK